MTDNIITLCNQIQRRAMKTKRVIFHVDLNRDVQRLTVIARAREHNYMTPTNTWPAPLMRASVYFRVDDAESVLNSVLDEMKELGRKPL